MVFEFGQKPAQLLQLVQLLLQLLRIWKFAKSEKLFAEPEGQVAGAEDQAAEADNDNEWHKRPGGPRKASRQPPGRLGHQPEANPTKS